MLGFEGPPPFEFAFAEGLPTPPGEDELREVMAAIFAARLGGILSGPPPVPTAPRTPCRSAWAEPAPPPVGPFLGAAPVTAAGADARGLRAGGGPGEALAALTGDCVAVEGGEVMVEVDVDVDGEDEDEDEEEDSGWSETAPTPCSSCCTLLSAILL